MGKKITAVAVLLPGLPWDVQGQAQSKFLVASISIADNA
jgi:hypothetical protein